MSNLVLNNINKSFRGKQVLNNVSLQIKGSFGLLGPNGAGKTTLMRIIATLEKQDNGSIHLEDISWENVKKVRNHIGYLPQHFSIYKNLTIKEVMNHFAILKGLTIKTNRNTTIDNILSAVNLMNEREKKIKNLSGGMLRRLGIAQALLGNPKIIIVDEPTAGLDIEERVRFRQLLRKLSEDRIIIISSHIVEDLESTCNNIAIMKQGKVLQTGSRKELIEITTGMVWEIEIPIEKKLAINEEDIISTKQLSDSYLVRFFSESYIPNAKLVETTLEDTYLYLTKRVNVVC
ncbi:ABC transporter ATP-binding protein [Niallia sp. 03091]|uniref:ABC transporter ATP-binding protein n=1 Tax=unclassified Niallia TaxID=2837522 RepID=UPI0040444618